MLKDCLLLKELNLSSFNTFNELNLKEMFKGGKSLEKLNLPNFVSNDAGMGNMFEGFSKELEEKAKAQI